MPTSPPGPPCSTGPSRQSSCSPGARTDCESAGACNRNPHHLLHHHHHGRVPGDHVPPAGAVGTGGALVRFLPRAGPLDRFSAAQIREIVPTWCVERWSDRLKTWPQVLQLYGLYLQQRCSAGQTAGYSTRCGAACAGSACPTGRTSACTPRTGTPCCSPPRSPSNGTVNINQLFKQSEEFIPTLCLLAMCLASLSCRENSW